MRMSDVVSRDTLLFKRLKFYKGEENLRHSGLVEKAFGVKLRYRALALSFGSVSCNRYCARYL